MDINKWPSGVPGINCSISLDEILVVCDAYISPSNGAYDSHRYRITQPKGVPDSKHKLTDLKVIRVAPWYRWKILIVNLDQGYIRLGVHPYNLCLKNPPVVKCNLNLISMFDHVVVGHYISVIRDNNTGAETLFLPFPRRLVKGIEKIKKGIVKERRGFPLDGLCC
ncbi:hypothetical protein BMS3Bbin06_00561 [bacterium BMS3Bbin06]|nr:hypothetical protein BMS3Bbin06_00561 [bacterium BMS3Bbin06]